MSLKFKNMYIYSDDTFSEFDSPITYTGKPSDSILYGTVVDMLFFIVNEEGENTVVDNNTLPTKSTIRKKLKQIHAMSLKLIGMRIMDAKSNGAILTHATDSTTRKHVGSFAPAGVHVNRDEYIPLPTLPMSSETTKSVAEAIEIDFKLVGAAAGLEASELYANIDVHMTDATAHNKGISVECAKLMNREEPAGQLFCNAHTALGFDRGMESVINEIEVCMRVGF